MAPAPLLMTVDEYFKTPETVVPTELVFGAMRVAESPTPRHQSAVRHLLLALNAHVEERQLGEMWVAPLDVVLSERRALIVQPDLFFVSNDRSWIVTDRIRGAPDLVIEVLSPNPRIGKTEERIGWFGEFGVRECWLLHQLDVSMTVIRFEAGREQSREVFGRRQKIASGVLPDFSATLDEIFCPIDWSKRIDP